MMLNFGFIESKRISRRVKHCHMIIVGMAEKYELVDLVTEQKHLVSGPQSWFRRPDTSLLASTYHRLLLQLFGNELELNSINNNLLRSYGNPLEMLTMLQKFCAEDHDDNRHGGELGFIGYFGFEFTSYLTTTTLPNHKQDGLRVPGIMLTLLKRATALVDGKSSWVVRCCSSKAAYGGARKKIRSCFKATCTVSSSVRALPTTRPWNRSVRSTNRKIYLNLVRRMLVSIGLGELMQAQLSRRFSVTLTFYERMVLMVQLLKTNLSSYTFMLDCIYFRIVGTSPEILVEKSGANSNSSLIIKPIAGTRPRGKDYRQDIKFRNELANDSKEVSEHIMLVDLARNDLSCASGNELTETSMFLHIELYSYVQHIISTVHCAQNSLTKDTRILEHVFPAGTVSGTPKTRAIGLISSLERMRRSFYGGAVGMVFPQKLELAITIRSGLLLGHKLYVQSAAGIVLESVPECELRETENKVISALDIVRAVQKGIILWSARGVAQ